MKYFVINTITRIISNISITNWLAYFVDFIATLVMLIAIIPFLYIINLFFKFDFSMKNIAFSSQNTPFFMNILFYNFILLLNKEYKKTDEYKEFYYLNIFQKKYYLIKYSIELDELMFITTNSKMLHKISHEGKKKIIFYKYYRKNILIEYKKTLRHKFFSLDLIDFFIKFNLLKKDLVFKSIIRHEKYKNIFYTGFILWTKFNHQLQYHDIQYLLTINDYPLEKSPLWVNYNKKNALKYKTWHNLLKNHKNYKNEAQIVLDEMRK